MATERQKKILENLGKGKTMRGAMLEAGYSENYANNPKQVKETEGFAEIFNKYVSDELIAKATREMVNYRQPVMYQFSEEMEEEQLHKVLKKMGFKKSQYHCIKVKEVKIFKGQPVEIGYWGVYGSKPSGLVIPKGVDIAMKGKGYYAPDKIAFTDTEGKNLVPTELDKELEELESKLRVNYIKEVKNGSGDDKGADRSKDSGDKKAKA